MSDPKIYVGKGKKRGDKWLSVTINPDKLVPHIKDYNGIKYVKLNINILDTPDQYGKDVSITLDTFDPGNKPIVKATIKTESYEGNSDLQF